MLHFGAVDYAATVWVNGTCLGAHRGGYTPFTVRHHRRGAPGWPVRADRARRRRPARPGEAARQAGLAARSRTRSGIRAPPASGRPSGWSGCRRRGIGRLALDAEPGALGDRRRGLDSTAHDVSALRLCASRCRAGGMVLADDTYTVVAGEVHRRIALSDPGIDDSRNELLWSPHAPTLIDAQLELLGRARRTARRGHELHGAALDRRAGRSLRAERPALHAAPGARPGLLAGRRADRARRRGAAARRRAGQGDGLQRRAQAPEDRGPALPLLGRPPRPAGVGGDAERLPLHPGLGRAADPRVDRGDRSATTATRASSRGCRSTSRGACRTCPTTRASATTSRRSTT